MGKHTSRRQRSEQRQLRRRRGERAFLFDGGLSCVLAEFDREEWERALSACGGNTAEAAEECGVKDARAGMKALWGRSAGDARDRYRQWQARRARSR
jgi:hypothetical protein